MASATPILIVDREMQPLDRMPLQMSKSAGGHDERWLQELIQKCPSVLPIGEIEPGFGALIPVAMEVPCGHGNIDNLFVTPEGGVAIVETKLWRNPEARRIVVAQALDYASALARKSYAEFEHAALMGQFPAGQPAARSLHSLVAEHGDALPESAFIDAVSLNLRRGRMLVIAAGDGMRAETEALADLLQSHAGARFTFALVVIELFRAPGGGILAIPKTLAKTTLIERGVVRIVESQAVIEPVSSPVGIVARSAQRATMTKEMFLERMFAIRPGLDQAIDSFLERLAELGVWADWLQSLNLKWTSPVHGDVNLGYIKKDGALSTDATNWRVGAIAQEYQTDMARLTGGNSVVLTESNGPILIAPDGSNIKIQNVLPSKASDWIEAIKRFIGKLEADASAKT